jgi:hypothetical protein
MDANYTILTAEAQRQLAKGSWQKANLARPRKMTNAAFAAL